MTYAAAGYVARGIGKEIEDLFEFNARRSVLRLGGERCQNGFAREFAAGADPERGGFRGKIGGNSV